MAKAVIGNKLVYLIIIHIRQIIGFLSNTIFKKSKIINVITSLFFAFLIVGNDVYADILTFDASVHYNITAEQTPGYDVRSNYFAGYSYDEESGIKEHRNYFRFNPVFLGTITSATLLINTAGYASLDDFETYAVYSIPSSFNFDDIGSGINYGEKNFYYTDQNEVVEVLLNSYAITSIFSDSPFWMGGKITSLVATDRNEALFAGSTYSLTPQLKITFEPCADPIPEPGTITLLGIGLAGLGLYGYRRKKKK